MIIGKGRTIRKVIGGEGGGTPKNSCEAKEQKKKKIRADKKAKKKK